MRTFAAWRTVWGVLSGAVLAGSASAQPVSVAEFLPAERTQSRGIGNSSDSLGVFDRAGSQTFIPDQTELLFDIRLQVENRGVFNGVGLTVELRRAIAGTDAPDLTGGALGSVTLLPEQVPSFPGNTGFLDPIGPLLTSFNFASQSILLEAGTEYAIIIKANGARAGTTTNFGTGYGIYAPGAFASPVPDVNYGESSDGGASFLIFGNNFDVAYQVRVPEPTAALTAALLLPTLLRRRGR